MAPERGKKPSKTSDKATRPGSPGSRPCPSACGFFISATDTHEACPMCLGMLHAKAALLNPESCAHCHQLRQAVRERRVQFLMKTLGNSATAEDPLLSESLSPTADLESDELDDTGVLTWGDQMDILQSEEDKDTKSRFDTQDMLQSDEVSLIASKSDIFDDEQDVEEEAEALSQGTTAAPGETDGSTSASFDLCRRAAESLNVTWPAPPPRQQQTRLAGNYFLPRQQAAVRHKMPVFPDFLTKLTRSWSSPRVPLSLPLSQFLDVEGRHGAYVNLLRKG